MITQQHIDDQVKYIQELQKTLNGKQSEFKNAANKLNFDNLKGLKEVMANMDSKKPETVMNAIETLRKEAKKMFKNQK